MVFKISVTVRNKNKSQDFVLKPLDNAKMI